VCRGGLPLVLVIVRFAKRVPGRTYVPIEAIVIVSLDFSHMASRGTNSMRSTQTEMLVDRILGYETRGSLPPCIDLRVRPSGPASSRNRKCKCEGVEAFMFSA